MTIATNNPGRTIIVHPPPVNPSRTSSLVANAVQIAPIDYPSEQIHETSNFKELFHSLHTFAVTLAIAHIMTKL